MKAWFQQFMDFARRNPLIVASLSVIVLIGGASYFLWQRQRELTVTREEIRNNGEDMLQALSTQPRITAESATVTEALNFIDRNLLNEADLAENLGYFYQIETAARIRFSQLNQLSSQPPPPDSQFRLVPFSLKATGTYRQVMRLLHELETGPRQLRIRNYTFAQAGGPEDDSVTMDLSVDLLARP